MDEEADIIKSHFWSCNFFTGNVILALGYHSGKFALLVLYLKPEYFSSVGICVRWLLIMIDDSTGTAN